MSNTMIGIADIGLLDRMVSAVEKVRERLLRATAALDRAGVLYAVVGGNAVASWVASMDEAAVRNTRDVDILLRREDLARASAVLEGEGFVYRHVRGVDMFLDGPDTKARDAVHVLFAGEKVHPNDFLPAPDISEGERAAFFRVLSLEALVRVKLNVFRTKDQMHLRDMLDVGLIDAFWTSRYPPELADRLQLLIDTPEG
jgi:hypothetical protein